jgi:hypothetical protein
MVSSGRLISIAFLAAALGLVLASCGGPTSPSGVATLRGTVLDETAGAAPAAVVSEEAAGVSAQSAGNSSSVADVTVAVQEAPGLTATVAKDGTFSLSGLPTGTITLVFSRNGRELGRLTIEDVLAGEQLDIKVKVRGNGVTLLDLQRSSPGPSPSPTASPTASPSPSGACMISGGLVGAGIELEGSVSEGTAASFMLLVQGNRSAGPVTVDASGATFQCHPASGPNAPTLEACKASVKSGAKVHVDGSLVACDASTASASARKVIVQKAGS